MNLPDGHLLQEGKYKLAHAIGQGGFGITYLGVWNTEVKGELGAMKTKVPVCIKEYFFKDYCYREQTNQSVLVHSDTGKALFDKFKEKLIKEANILSAVHHPNIVNVLEVFEENNTAYIVMEYITGCSLKYMIEKQGILPENKVLKYIHQIGNALDFVHKKNIVHLDIKPSNILIDREDNARLIDFGVSKRYDMEQQETSTTMLTLSKGFASIEQYDDEGTQSFSPCPDIYSLGATMYNLLTNVIPVESILRVTKAMPSPRSYNSNISGKTENVILRAMEIRSEDRYQSVKEMLASLDIPPYELAENLLVEKKEQKVDDTEVLGMMNAVQKLVADEETDVLNTPEVKPSLKPSLGYNRKRSREREKKRRRQKRVKRLLWIFLLLSLLSMSGYLVYKYYPSVYNDLLGRKRVQNGLTQVIAPADKRTEALEKEGEQEGAKRDGSAVKTEEKHDSGQEPPEVQGQPEQSATKPADRTQEKTKEKILEKKAEKQPVSDSKSKKEETQPSVENNVDKEYNDLISKAKSYLENRKYQEAQQVLMEAVKKKSTDEAITLLQLCKEKEMELKTEERLKQYQILTKFGNLNIARNKATNRYGAINSKGEEIIPCKYMDTDKSINGRAFLRQDELYDIYDVSGKRVASGLKSFD